MTTPTQKLSRFAVHFIGGVVIEVTAPNAAKAEQMARRETPGVILRIQHLERV